MLKKCLAVCGIALLSLAATVVNGQEVVTLILRDGQRFTGEVPELDASGFTLRANGQDRVFPASQVAAIEYVPGSPPEEARTRLDGGQSLIVLRNGQIIDGRLVDIGGTSPKRLTVNTPSGDRDFMSTDVKAVYLYAPGTVPPPAAAAAAATAAQAAPLPAGAIAVQANQPWTPTFVKVRKGDRLMFNATGDILIAPNASSGIGGSPAVTGPGVRYPVQISPAGALIARIGNGKPFAIANGQPMPMPTAGDLYLGVNDDHFEDNSGSFAVSITRTK